MMTFCQDAAEEERKKKEQEKKVTSVTGKFC